MSFGEPLGVAPEPGARRVRGDRLEMIGLGLAGQRHGSLPIRPLNQLHRHALVIDIHVGGPPGQGAALHQVSAKADCGRLAEARIDHLFEHVRPCQHLQMDAKPGFLPERRHLHHVMDPGSLRSASTPIARSSPD
jgi:hypothetical protein